MPVKPDNSAFPQLMPFSNLRPDRLKLSGRGQWDPTHFLDPELYMAFQEPQVLELSHPVFERGVPNFEVDKKETVLQLFRRWDELGLLALHPKSSITTGESGRVKIFNAYKDPHHDRQIGDRRERNAWEARLPGPSKSLPVGPLIGRLCVPRDCGLKVCITDRSDYYHQLGTSFERSRSNIVWPPMQLKDFVQFKAYQHYTERAKAQKHKVDRTVDGDDLSGHRQNFFPTTLDAPVYGAFTAILQGDHLGVEFGISAHVGLLQSAGLLQDAGRLVTDRLLRPSPVYQGLCIDDYFCIAPVDIGSLSSGPEGMPSPAKKAFLKAKETYSKFGLDGSDHKDVIDQTLATVVGAEIDSRPCVVEQGCLPVAAPAAKRLSLSWIAATASRYPCTTDALHSSLLGGLVSAFCFRKCGMAVFNELFKIIPPAELDPERPVLRPLPRAAAEELILSAVLLPITSTDVKAPLASWIFASDASNHKGAFVSAEIPEDIALPLWQAGDFKGGYTMLEPWPKDVLKAAEDFDEEDWHALQNSAEAEGGISPQCCNPGEQVSAQRPLAQYYDFIEVCGGSGVVSEQVAAMGFVVGPIIDITFSQHYNLLDLRAIEWLLFMVQNRRVKAVALEPPCTTFSPAAYPPCRSYTQPRGFNQKSQKVWVGNKLAFACFTIFLACIHALVVALIETPRRSKMAWLEEWKRLLRYENVEETFTASCSFGSIHQKEFRFLTCNMLPHSICRPCTRDHSHVKIEGQYTKGSAVYCPGLAKALAELFAKHIRALDGYVRQHSLDFSGLESVFVNEVMKVSSWKLGAVWRWNGVSHINVLELTSALKAVKEAALRDGGKVLLLLDSNVCVRALAKGSSSSRALLFLLRKVAVISLCFGIYLSVHFCPTRLNIAYDPTRDAPLRSQKTSPSCLSSLDLEGLFRLAELPRLRRWISNWTSLFLGLCCKHHVPCGALSIHHPRLRSSSPPVDFYRHLLDFDSTLGFPGEGPVVRWILFLALAGVDFSHGMLPRNRHDEARAASRSLKPLQTGRPVQQVTRTNREKLLETFASWVGERGGDLSVLLSNSYLNPEALVQWLVLYGKELYTSGRPYSHFSETINAVAAAKPSIRRLLTGAWDVAFWWVKEEPSEHHTACPFQILLALLSTAILWGWPLVAGAIALSWGAVCRIGEVMHAIRDDLVLPQDVLFSNMSVYLKVKEPKTRYKAARHQMSKLDYQDLVELVACVFGSLKGDSRLWPFSPQLLRTRFKQLLKAVGLPTDRQGQERALDLGSLRAGGATHLLMITEDAELVRRRGRWLAPRTMEIYIQEISSTVFFPRLPRKVKDRVMELALSFPALLDRLKVFAAAAIPASAGFVLIQTNSDGTDGSNKPGEGLAQRGAQGMRAKTAWKAEKKAVEQLAAVETQR